MNLENTLSGRSQKGKILYNSTFIKITRVGRLIETENKMVVANARERMNGKSLFNAYRISVGQYEEFRKWMVVMVMVLHKNVYVLNTTEMSS